MKTLLLIGCGSFAGGVLRYGVSRLLQGSQWLSLPVGNFLREYPRMPAARDLLRSAGALPGAVGGDQAALYRGVLRQFHDIFGFYSRKPAVAAPVGSGGVGALRLVERGVGAAGRPCGALACENGVVRAGILIGYPEKVTIFAR